MPLSSSPDIQHETMKHLELPDIVKDLAGFVAPTPAEHMLEEEFK